MRQHILVPRSQLRALATMEPIGDPFGGPAYRQKNDPGTISIISTISSVVGGISTVAGLFGGKESSNQASQASQQAADETKLARQTQEKIAAADAQRKRIEQLRQARIARANVISGAGNQGIGQSSSGVVGSVSSVNATTAGNIGTINQVESFGQIASTHLQNAADATSKYNSAVAEGAGWQSLTNFGEKLFDSGGGFTSIFGGNTFPGQSSTDAYTHSIFT